MKKRRVLAKALFGGVAEREAINEDTLYALNYAVQDGHIESATVTREEVLAAGANPDYLQYLRVRDDKDTNYQEGGVEE